MCSVLAGNIGSPVMFNILGPEVGWCFILAQLNRQLQTHILITGQIWTQVKEHFSSRGVDTVQFSASESGPVDLYELLKEADEANDEWMYALKNHNSTSWYFPLHTFGGSAWVGGGRRLWIRSLLSVWMILYRGGWSEAKKKFVYVKLTSNFGPL